MKKYINRRDIMKKYINRNVEEEVISLSKSFPVVMITGPRQVGKSTLLNYISKLINKNIDYVSLNNINDRTLALEDPEMFLEIHPSPVIIDEFQYAPNLLSYIKINVDNSRLKEFENGKSSNGMYFLTGSQSFLSMKNVSESLAGRVGIIDLYGLSLREIRGEESKLFIPEIESLRHNKNNCKYSMREIFEKIFKGSFPEVYQNPELSLQHYFEGYIKTYIERDIRELINVKDEVKFMKFITSVAARTGNELNLSEIANDAEITNPTANDWLSILVNTGLVVLIEPYSNNII